MGGLLYVHVAISLVGIATGFIVAFGMLSSKPLRGWTALFLWSTVATSVTGFPLPAKQILPSHILGVLSLIALALALYALYSKRLAGPWRATYVINAILALYFNVFVLVVQCFRNISTLHVLAPTESEPPFAIAQGVVLIAFIVLGIATTKRFRPH
jgi:hypothetical protein